jgi:hypothetical protein
MQHDATMESMSMPFRKQGLDPETRNKSKTWGWSKKKFYQTKGGFFIVENRSCIRNPQNHRENPLRKILF